MNDQTAHGHSYVLVLTLALWESLRVRALSRIALTSILSDRARMFRDSK
jgi:hypothetical protein